MPSPSPRSHRPTRANNPSARYSASRGTLSGKIIAIVAVLFAIAAIVVAVQYMQKLNNGTVDGTVTGFERVDENHIDTSIDITRENVEEDSYCIVTAMNFDAVEVGRREVFIPAGGDRTTRIRTTITTRDIPVAVDLYGCATTIPSYLTGEDS